MDRQEIQEIILRVLAEYAGQGAGREIPLDFPVEVSARHVHLTGEAVEHLFGAGAKLTPRRPLSQPGQFLSEERVTLVTPGGRIENVAVLGPERSEVQAELSVTDCRTLGLHAPICMSGDLAGAGDVYIVGPKGMIEARESVIVARAHVHITPPQAQQYGITDGQQVSVALCGEREVTLHHVICRVSSQAALAMHIDYDEANACMLPKNATARMRVAAIGATVTEFRPSADLKPRSSDAPVHAVPSVSAADSGPLQGNLITEAVARRLAAGRKTPLTIARGVILTPSAKDVLNHAGIAVLRQQEVSQRSETLRQPPVFSRTGGGRV